jgi:hypothetical protein
MTAPTTPQAPAPGTPEYDAAMAAKFTGTVTTAGEQPPAAAPAAAPAADPARPAWLPEKFKTVEDFARSYAELEKKLGGQPPASPEGQPAGQPPATQPGPKDGLKVTEGEAKAAVQAAGIDYDALTQEFNETGALKPETFAALESKGIPKPMVEAFIAGQQALVAQFESSVHESVGGKESFGKIQAWANQNLSPAEKASLNAAIDTGNLEATKLAYAGVKARFDAAYGSPGQQITGQPAASLDVYESHAQMTADIKNPLYAKDPAYRAKVEAKIGRSNALWPVQRM